MKKVVVIIGAGPGISHAIAQKFGNKGFKIWLIARTGSKLEEMSSQLLAKGIDNATFQADAGKELALKQALQTIIQTDGLPELIVYNASATSVIDILDQKWEVIKSLMDVNVGGCFHTIQYMLPGFLSQNRGKIFVTNGGSALNGDIQWAALSMGKAALRNMVQAFQKKIAGSHVHIAQVTVCGYVKADDPKFNPTSIAEIYWNLYLQKPEHFEQEVIY